MDGQTVKIWFRVDVDVDERVNKRKRCDLNFFFINIYACNL